LELFIIRASRFRFYLAYYADKITGMAKPKQKRKKKEKSYALKTGSIDGIKRICNSYDELKKYFDPCCRLPHHKSFDTYQEAYNWLHDIDPPPPPPSNKQPPLF
jgi:hypothetical protein